MKKYVTASTDSKELYILADDCQKIRNMLDKIEDVLHEAHYDLELDMYELRGLNYWLRDCSAALQLLFRDYSSIFEKLDEIKGN